MQLPVIKYMLKEAWDFMTPFIIILFSVASFGGLIILCAWYPTFGNWFFAIWAGIWTMVFLCSFFIRWYYRAKHAVEQQNVITRADNNSGCK